MTETGIEQKKQRNFGLMVGIACLVLAALLFWKENSATSYFAGAGVLLLILAAAAPGLLRPLERIWMRLARAMGWVMTRVILGVLFLIVFTPAGLIIRLLKRDPLGQRIEPEAESYWKPRSKKRNRAVRMERMY